MANMKNAVAAVATMAVVVIGQGSFAQDDLDDLLKDLESEAAQAKKAKPAEEQPVAKPAEAPTDKVEEPKAAEAAEAPATAEPAAAKPAEEQPAAKPAEAPAAKAEEPKATEAAEAPAVAESAAEKPAEEPAAAAKAEEPPAEKPAVVAKAAPEPVDPDAQLVDVLVKTEQLRRTARDQQAAAEMAEADACMARAEYNDAVRHYGQAKRLLNDRPGSKENVKKCEAGIAEGLYKAALQEKELGRQDRAIALIEKAVDMRHPKARHVLETWVAAAGEVETETDISEIKHRHNDDDYKDAREQIRRRLRRSRQLLAVKDLDGALDEVEIVLANDKHNQEAIRLRDSIQKKRQTILQQERQATRDGMIADVDKAWRPVYAVGSTQLNDVEAETVKAQTGEDPERTQEQDIERRMKAMRLPTISFKPPATIMDAVEFFRGASKDFDRPDIPPEKRGFNFMLRLPPGSVKAAAPAEQGEAADDFSASASENSAAASSNGLDPIPTITASDISFYEALKLVCESVQYKFIVHGPIVQVMPKDMSTDELLSRKYNVPEAFMERVNTASDEMKEMGGFGGGKKSNSDEGEEGKDTDWKAFFGEMGVNWPEGSSIKHIKSLGKLYVRNTRENLAVFDKVLDELGGQPQLIEIETRFVEVSQEDLNSLGFEWILNSDYSLNLGNSLGKALGIRNGTWGSDSAARSRTVSTETTMTDVGTVGKSSKLSTVNDKIVESTSTTSARYVGGRGNTWTRDDTGVRGLGINGFGGTSDYQNGSRYLSTTSNSISGESKSTNDQFMRVNAFLGNADLSMILHMLSQRTDTDLLSAPKIVGKSGELATIKVVTEYIYPTDYDVQLQSSSSSGSSGGTGSSSAILAVVEPQSFTMREVGVILEVTPTYNEANGGSIDLELKPQVVEEPTWKNYGMKIPFTGNPSSGIGVDPASLFNWIPGATERLGDAVNNLIGNKSEEIATTYVDSAMQAMNPSTITYYEAPMEQPWFHVRMIDSKVSITPGSTVVMGGLITEQRKAMDDKVPFLGDLPFVGRFFRSHAEQTIKRNLLIFVTGRLITPSGRELRVGEDAKTEAEVAPAPKAD